MERDRTFLLALVVAFGALALFVVLPYLQYVLFAGLLAYVLEPVHRRLAPHVGRRVAAGGLVGVTVVAILGPLAGALVVVVREARDVAGALRDGGLDVAALQRLVEEAFGDGVAPTFRPGDQLDAAAMLGNVVDVAGGVADLVVGATVLLFVLYYLLADGDRLYRWTRSATPLPTPIQDRLYAALDRLFWGVLVANVLVAVVQGVLTGVAMAVVGFGNVLFWIAVVSLLALLPLIGAPVVWIPAAAYLVLGGRPVAGVLLALWGVVVVSIADDYLRPVATGRGAHVSPGILVVGIFGGVATLGFAGLFYGPIVLGFVKALVTEFSREVESGPAVAAD